RNVHALHTCALYIFKLLLFIILPITAFDVFKNKKIDTTESEGISTAKKYLVLSAAAFLIGRYDGFYGPGTGTFLLLIYTGLAKKIGRASCREKVYE